MAEIRVADASAFGKRDKKVVTDGLGPDQQPGPRVMYQCGRATLERQVGDRSGREI